MTKVKNALLILISLIVILALFLNFDLISEKLKKLFNVTPDLIILPANEYKKTEEFELVKQVDDYVPNNYQDLMNIFYSTLNQGWDDFTFYCPIEYVDCLKDVERLSLDEDLLSNINNFVHPYNSYSSVKTLYDETGKVQILVTHLYNKSDISLSESYIDALIDSLIKEDMTTSDKIKALHDYIINNTKYDSKRAESGSSVYDSARIMGIINDHYAICSGYADLMAALLNRLGIPNFKVSSESHVWNVVLVNNKWLHLDLTWDDPITNTGRDILDHSYFLIDNDKLSRLHNDNNEHKFDKNVYKELDY